MRVCLTRLLCVPAIAVQAGDLMAKSSHVAGSGKARFLTPTDVREIERVTAAVPHIGSPDYIVPGSMGAPAC